MALWSYGIVQMFKTPSESFFNFKKKKKKNVYI